MLLEKQNKHLVIGGDEKYITLYLQRYIMYHQLFHCPYCGVFNFKYQGQIIILEASDKYLIAPQQLKCKNNKCNTFFNVVLFLDKTDTIGDQPISGDL